MRTSRSVSITRAIKSLSSGDPGTLADQQRRLPQELKRWHRTSLRLEHQETIEKTLRQDYRQKVSVMIGVYCNGFVLL